MKYVRNLHAVDDRVQSVSPQIHKSNRPFVGVVVVCDEHKYCVPSDHPKAKHLTMKSKFLLYIESGLYMKKCYMVP
jgi:protein AbiQ